MKFLRYADDVAIGVIGPKSLAEHLREELAAFLAEDLQLELNRQKTGSPTWQPNQPTSRDMLKTATPRYRKRNLRSKGSPHNVVQTVKTTSGNIKLLVPLRDPEPKVGKVHG